MPYQTGLPAALKRFGLRVEVVPGWERRGASGMNPAGALSHWTAGPRTGDRPSLGICVNGRAGLPGPLCNVFLTRAGVAVVVAAGVANHGGVGSWQGVSGNSRFFGTEAESSGDGWTPEQRAAYPRINAAYCHLGGFGPHMLAGHHEYAKPAGRKIDIRDWPMPLMRKQVAAILAGTTTTQQEDDMPTLSEIWGHDVGGEKGNQPAWAVLSQARTASQSALAQLAALRVTVGELVEVVADRKGLDPVELKRLIGNAIDGALADAVVQVDVKVAKPTGPPAG